MQDQLCVKIDIAVEEEEGVRARRVRNRRYKKMLELREKGFFSEDSIKLRHPLLYHNYLGENTHRSRPSALPPETTLTQFLEKNLINLQYKHKLAQELAISSSQMEEEPSMSKIEEEKGEQEFDPCRCDRKPPAWEVVEQEQIELEEQDLIDHAEQLFLEGKVDPNYVNYKEIDNNSAYDELDLQNRDAEEEYFREQSNEEDAQINRKHYTGIQDF